MNGFVDQFDTDDNKTRPGVPVDAGRIAQALRKHWRVLPTTVGISALIAVAIALLVVKPAYTAKATLLWEPHAEGGDPSDRSFLTQVDSIKLSSNLVEVKRRLKSKATLDELKEKITLVFDGQSHLVAVEASDTTAKGAMTFAKTVVDVFLDYQRSIGRDRGGEHLKRLDADIAAAQAQLTATRESYDTFRRELGVADYDAELKLALSKVAELKQGLQLSSAEADTEMARQRQLSAEGARQPATTVSMSTMSNPDAMLLAQVQAQLTSERAHLSADHPSILRLESQVAQLQQKLRTNPELVRGPMSVTVNPTRAAIDTGLLQSKLQREAAIERGEGYKRLLAESEQRLAQLTAVQGRAEQLQSAVTSQEAHKNELAALRVRTLDQTRNAAVDFRVVTPASLPDKANPSARRAVVIRLPLLALVLALLGIVGNELRGLRVHTAREAGFWANAAVVASSTWPREQTTLGALVDELSDAAPAVRGTTLVVGARANEVPLAREVAYWLSHLTAGMQQQRSIVGADEPVVANVNAQVVASEIAASTPSVAPPGSALMLRGSGSQALTIAQAWDGPVQGPSLRRASRLADRVLVVVAAGTMSVTEIAQLRSRLGRSEGIGLLLVGLNPEFITLPDRVGEVERFWEDRAA